MADKTTGELRAVNVGDLPGSTDIYDDFKMPGELQGEAVHVTGAQFKQYAVQAVKPIADGIDEKVVVATNAGAAAQSALAGVRDALNNLPEGDTLIINDLTTGGTTAALSAEMGKVLNRRPNPNLLHNWYFANPVNQRGGYIVQPNTPWFTDLSFSTVGGYTDGYYKYTPYNIACGSVQIGNQVGFVAADNMTLGYVGGGYTIDRWVNGGYTCAVFVRDGYVELDGNGLWFEQRLDTSLFDSLVGKQIAFSMLLSDGELLYGSGTVQADGQTNLFYRASDNIYGQIGADIGVRIVTFDTSKRNLKIVAVKLELGDTQTLAHWDGSKWVLNEIPDYGEELAKCQRYQIVLDRIRVKHNNLTSTTDILQPIVFPATMRISPGISYDVDQSGVEISTDYAKTHAILRIMANTSVDTTFLNVIFDANL